MKNLLTMIAISLCFNAVGQTIKTDSFYIASSYKWHNDKAPIRFQITTNCGGTSVGDFSSRNTPIYGLAPGDTLTTHSTLDVRCKIPGCKESHYDGLVARSTTSEAFRYVGWPEFKNSPGYLVYDSTNVKKPKRKK